MRVIFWSETFWPNMGGAELFAVSLLRGLRDRGYEFIVITRQDDPSLPTEAKFEGVPVYRIPFYQALAGSNVNQLIAIRQQVNQLKRCFTPDLVHINCFGPSILFHLDTTKTHPAPLLITLHGERYDPVMERDTLLERTLRAADWVTAPSARTMEYARQLVPNFVPRGEHIYNGLDLPPVLPSHLPFNPPRLLCLGRLVPEKGFNLALAALAVLIERFPQVRMVIAGDGPVRSELEQQAADLGLSEVVDFKGWIAPEHVPELINTATVVVMPSRVREALPFVSLEAAFMARPVVAVGDGGVPEVVLHQKTGLLVEREDSVGLVQALTFLLEHPEVARQMGQSARHRAQEVFSIGNCLDAYDDLYQNLGKKVAHVSA